MNNLEKVNDILNYFKTLLKENENINITEDIIYDYLIKFGVPEEEVSKTTSGMFKNWKIEASNLDNIKIDNVESSLYCQFSDNENKIENYNNPIKLYVPIKYDYINDSVNKLLAFFSKKGMPFQMKISYSIRNNNIIIRLCSIEDMNKFLNFIKYNEYIKEGLLEPNPFCYEEEGIAITADGNLSYISAISNYLCSYINSLENVDDLKIHNFYNFIIDKYSANFINFNNYGSLKIPSKDENFDADDVVAYQSITELILKASEKSFNKDEFEKHINEYNDEEKIKKSKKTYNLLNTLVNYIKTQCLKMDLEEAINRMDLYLEKDNLSYISNVCSTRTAMYLSNFGGDLKDFLNEKGTNFIDFCEKLNIKKNEYKELSDNVIENMIVNTNKTLDKIHEVLENEDEKNINEIIQLYCATNDCNLITRENDLRKIVVDNKLRNNLLNILSAKNITLTDYLDIYKESIKDKENTIQEPVENGETTENNVNENPEIVTPTEEDATEIEPISEIVSTDNDTVKDETIIIQNPNEEINYNEILIDAINTTYKKYQKKYEDGEIEYDGISQVNFALVKVLINDDFSSFTSDNDARECAKLIGREKIFKIIIDELELSNVDLENINEESIKLLINRFVDYVVDTEDEKKVSL